MNMTLVWICLGLLFVLLLSLPIMFLYIGWERRRRHIVDGFTEAAIKAYFHAFHPRSDDAQIPIKERFENYYNAEIGRRRFVWPLLLLAAVTGTVLYWSAPSLSDLLQYETVDSGKLPALAMIAFAGAYMWVLFDAIRRWYASNLLPSDLYWWCFRLVIAVPMGYAAKDIFSEDFSPALVFLLGALPTTDLLNMMKRIAAQKMGFTESGGTEISELQKLQGIDIWNAERFAAEEITTILKLAYADPIRLTIRTGFNYSYVTDCICQALLWLYVEKDIEILRKSGLRSAYEVLDLWLDLNNKAEKEDAEKLLSQAAKDLGRSEFSLRNIFEQVALDPYTQFLFLSWSGLSKEDLGDHACQVFSAIE